jgi:hypothetical protein
MERRLRVFRNADELASGRYPPCPWVERTSSLLIHLELSAPRYSAAGRQRILDAYVEFASKHFSLHDLDPLAYGIGYLSTALSPQPLDAVRMSSIDGACSPARAASGLSSRRAPGTRAIPALAHAPETKDTIGTWRHRRGSLALRAVLLASRVRCAPHRRAGTDRFAVTPAMSPGPGETSRVSQIGALDLPEYLQRRRPTAHHLPDSPIWKDHSFSEQEPDMPAHNSRDKNLRDRGAVPSQRSAALR